MLSERSGETFQQRHLTEQICPTTSVLRLNKNILTMNEWIARLENFQYDYLDESFLYHFFPAGISLLKVNNENSRTMSGSGYKLTKTVERHLISHIVFVFP